MIDFNYKILIQRSLKYNQKIKNHTKTAFHKVLNEHKFFLSDKMRVAQ